MIEPTLDNIFDRYYTLYRSEAQAPSSTDDEYLIATKYFNEAIDRWADYDNTFWQQLFSTAQTDTSGGAALTVAANTVDYATPAAFKEAGGYMKVVQPNTVQPGNTTFRRYPIILPQEAQFRNELTAFCYFTSNLDGTWTLHMNPVPDPAIIGMEMDYIFYAHPTELEGGSDTTECPNVNFLIQRALGWRFRGSRNPYFQSSIEDSEDSLKIMKMRNDSGSWANPWTVTDNSQTQWGM